MKIKFLLFVLIILSLVSCSDRSQANLSADTNEIVTILEENAPSDFGYCDVSEYYYETFLNRMQGLRECHISKCNESSNFNEFGVFEFINVNTAKKGEATIKKYLAQSRQEFENGIIYNISEYPKFKNAASKRYNNFVVYTILKAEEAKGAYNEISNYIKEK